MSTTISLPPRLYSWALGSAVVTAVLFLLPVLVPLPTPEGYAPYAFHYSVTFLLPVALATLLCFFLAVSLANEYRWRSAEAGDPHRRRRLVILAVLLSPVAAAGLAAVGSLVLSSVV